jgi:hypothetical protein
MENSYDVFPATIGFDIQASPKSFIQNKTKHRSNFKAKANNIYNSVSRTY